MKREPEVANSCQSTPRGRTSADRDHQPLLMSSRNPFGRSYLPTPDRVGRSNLIVFVLFREPCVGVACKFQKISLPSTHLFSLTRLQVHTQEHREFRALPSQTDLGVWILRWALPSKQPTGITSIEWHLIHICLVVLSSGPIHCGRYACPPQFHLRMMLPFGCFTVLYSRPGFLFARDALPCLPHNQNPNRREGAIWVWDSSSWSPPFVPSPKRPHSRKG